VKTVKFPGKTDLVLFGCFCSIDGRFLLPLGSGVWKGRIRTLHGGSPMSIVDSLPYRSPIPKLLVFFRRSRDQWKAKCKAAKYENKSLKTRLAKMKESRDRWKAEARGLRSDLEAEMAPADEETKTRLRPPFHRPGRRCA
jgi:hypothetical protein